MTELQRYADILIDKQTDRDSDVTSDITSERGKTIRETNRQTQRYRQTHGDRDSDGVSEFSVEDGAVVFKAAQNGADTVNTGSHYSRNQGTIITDLQPVE